MSMRALLFACCLLSAPAVDAASSLKITRNGVTTNYTEPVATFVGSGNRENLQVLVTTAGEYHRFNLSAPRGESLTRRTYTLAERAAFRSGRAPGLDLASNGSGCNEVWGSFTIRQIGFAPTGEVNLLEAVISHQCESSTAPKTSATLLLNAEPLYYNFSSTAGDFLGQGRAHSYFGHTTDFALSGTATGLSYTVSGDRDDWYVSIAPPSGQTLAVGTYTTARFAGAGVAGLDVSTNGRGCNTSHGTLNVRDLRVDGSGRVTGLYATYTQYCGANTAPLKGTIRWFR